MVGNRKKLINLPPPNFYNLFSTSQFLIPKPMDIFAHALWTGAAAAGANKKIKRRKINIRWAIFWGVLPDFFAFTIPFIVLAIKVITGTVAPGDIPHPSAVEPADPPIARLFAYTRLLYSVSHSAIIFMVIFGIVFLLLRRPPIEMLGWLLHIIIDIPTHSYRLYPTPIFWPVSSWQFDGISWVTPWFMIMNYGSLAVVYLLLYFRK